MRKSYLGYFARFIVALLALAIVVSLVVVTVRYARDRQDDTKQTAENGTMDDKVDTAVKKAAESLKNTKETSTNTSAPKATSTTQPASGDSNITAIPATGDSLPETGPTENVAAIAGISFMVLALSKLRKSQNQVKQSLITRA